MKFTIAVILILLAIVVFDAMLAAAPRPPAAPTTCGAADAMSQALPAMYGAADATTGPQPATTGAAQERRPLTDERIRQIDDETHFHESPDWPLRFARGIEAAQGIK